LSYSDRSNSNGASAAVRQQPRASRDDRLERPQWSSDRSCCVGVVSGLSLSLTVSVTLVEIVGCPRRPKLSRYRGFSSSATAAGAASVGAIHQEQRRSVAAGATAAGATTAGASVAGRQQPEQQQRGFSSRNDAAGAASAEAITPGAAAGVVAAGATAAARQQRELQ